MDGATRCLRCCQIALLLSLTAVALPSCTASTNGATASVSEKDASAADGAAGSDAGSQAEGGQPEAGGSPDAGTLPDSSVPPDAAGWSRPNIVFILADDLGYGDLGAYGQTRIKTPALDAMAAEGMRFTQAYATAPVCAPSRCGLLTGLHTGHCAVHRNTGPNTPLRDDDVTVGEVLQGAGYATGYVGKWGLGGELTDGTPHAVFSAPNLQGFDSFFGYLDQTLAHDYYPEWLWRDGQKVAFPENSNGSDVTYSHSLFTAEALKFIDEYAAGSKPFFLQVAYTIPHRENVIPDLGVYAGESWPPVEQAFAAMITLLDHDVGLILDRLAAHGIDQQTLVVFTSDNGPQETDTNGQHHSAEFFDSNGPLRGIKRDLYEGGIREPFIARWPGVIKSGSVTQTVISLQDFLPTAAELAGTSVPYPVDGVSILPTMTGAGTQAERSPLYWQAWESGGPGEEAPRYAIRRKDWKLIQMASGTLELYDVASDPGETHNLTSARPDIVQDLLSAMGSATQPLPGSPSCTVPDLGPIHLGPPMQYAWTFVLDCVPPAVTEACGQDLTGLRCKALNRMCSIDGGTFACLDDGQGQPPGTCVLPDYGPIEIGTEGQYAWMKVLDCEPEGLTDQCGQDMTGLRCKALHRVCGYGGKTFACLPD